MTDKQAAGLNEMFTPGADTDGAAQCRPVGM